MAFPNVYRDVKNTVYFKYYEYSSLFENGVRCKDTVIY